MNKTRYLAALALFVGLAFFALVSFWPFVLANIITPVALVIWLFLRLFVLSIDQNFLWKVLIFAVAFFVFYYLNRGPIPVQQELLPEQNATLKNIGYWRNILMYSADRSAGLNSLNQRLVMLLLSTYVSKQQDSDNYEVFEALRQQQIPIPAHIYNFLFADQPVKPRRSIKNLPQRIRMAAQKWIRKWTGREAAEQYQVINELLTFMETSLEIKYDNDDPSNH